MQPRPNSIRAVIEERLREPEEATRDNIPPARGEEDFGLSAVGERDPTPELDQGPAPGGSKPLKLTYFDDCGAFAEKRHILKGITAIGETLALIGPPGSGKSALITEMAVHSAGQIDWRGHKAKLLCGVVIFALERADLFKRRLKAYQQRDGLHGLPIAVADAVIDLLNPQCVETIVATVREAERQFGQDVGLIVIDTYAKGIAANGGDEDKAKDQKPRRRQFTQRARPASRPYRPCRAYRQGREPRRQGQQCPPWRR
jgi:hypothetical protein